MLKIIFLDPFSNTMGILSIRWALISSPIYSHPQNRTTWMLHEEQTLYEHSLCSSKQRKRQFIKDRTLDLEELEEINRMRTNWQSIDSNQQSRNWFWFCEINPIDNQHLAVKIKNPPEEDDDAEDESDSIDIGGTTNEVLERGRGGWRMWWWMSRFNDWLRKKMERKCIWVTKGKVVHMKNPWPDLKYSKLQM